AEKVGADAVSHGATGKGNDQVRFELGYYALKPDITIIAPWREWEFKSREQLIAFAEAHQIPIAKDKRNEAPFSVDANLLHASSEGKVLEDPALEVPDYVYSRTIDPEKAPDKPTIITVDFEKGDAVAIDGKKLSPATVLAGARDAAGGDRSQPAIGHRPRAVEALQRQRHPDRPRKQIFALRPGPRNLRGRRGRLRSSRRRRLHQAQRAAAAHARSAQEK